MREPSGGADRLNIYIAAPFGSLGMISKLAIVTALTIVTIAPASADAITGNVFNNAVYQQTGDNVPTLPPQYFFSIGADPANGYTSATATYPGGSQTLTQNGTSPTSFNYSSGFSPIKRLSIQLFRQGLILLRLQMALAQQRCS
jgi:hypothetical protein